MLVICQTPDQFSFTTYSSVFVKGKPNSATKEKVDQSLNELALKNNSLIVKRIPETNKNGHQFVYEKYGQGKLLDGMTEASKTTKKTSSVFLQYRILSGSLSNEQLANQFKELNYDPGITSKESSISVVMGFLVSSSIFLSLIIFLLTFTALTIIYRIKDLRSAGIRLISGETIWAIMFNSIKSDALTIGISFVSFGILSGLCFYILGIFQLGLWPLLLTALLIYCLLLLLISMLLSLIYLLGLRNINLVDTVKGKLPLRKLISITLVCQFLAVIAVGWGFGRIPLFYDELKEEQRAGNHWAKETDLVNIETGLASVYSNPQENSSDSSKWFDFVNDAVTNHNALMVHNNFLNFVSGPQDMDGNTIDSYNPVGNTIFVTPNYFKRQNIILDPKVKFQINNLQHGQLGLILPEKLKNDEKKYQEMFKNYFQFSTKTPFVIGYVANQQDRFVYNNTSISAQQFLKDPIIVVLTPKSTGKSEPSIIFWRNQVSDYLFGSGYEETINLLKKYNLYSSISDITSSQQNYHEQLQFFRNQVIALFISSILGVITSVLLFNSMNLLYFEEFRKEIFIKRIAGMRFEDLHFDYLAIQFLILIVGTGINLVFTKNFATSFLSFLIFALNSLLILRLQSKKENKYAATVLKGM